MIAHIWVLSFKRATVIWKYQRQCLTYEREDNMMLDTKSSHK